MNEFLSSLNDVMSHIFTKYRGCIIIRLENGLFQHGDFIGTLDECRQSIDKNIEAIFKSIS